MKIVNIGIIGYGIVGQGTVATILNNSDLITKKTGIVLNIKAIADRSIDRKINSDLAGIPIKTKDYNDILNDPEIDIVVELVGGDTVAKDIILGAAKKGKNIVTANKALLATKGEDIFNAVESNNVDLAFEAAVGGGIPIVKVIKEDLAQNEITSIEAIINGTANYILTRMTLEGKDYQTVLKDAQELGYAEADPTFDVEGIDSAHKIQLLASLAFGQNFNFNDIYIEGITNISSVDINYARELGCNIKLLAIAKRKDNLVSIRVHPTMVPNSSILSNVNYAYNAIHISGNFVEDLIFYGKGAGGNPTGSAVVSDIINIARNMDSCNKRRVPVLGYNTNITNNTFLSMDNISSYFYLRFTVKDTPGTLASIAGLLAKNNISIKSAIQKIESDVNNNQTEPISVPLVFLTHKTKGAQIRKAISEIDLLDVVVGKTVILRVEGNN